MLLVKRTNQASSRASTLSLTKNARVRARTNHCFLNKTTRANKSPFPRWFQILTYKILTRLATWPNQEFWQDDGPKFALYYKIGISARAPIKNFRQKACAMSNACFPLIQDLALKNSDSAGNLAKVGNLTGQRPKIRILPKTGAYARAHQLTFLDQKRALF